MENLIKELRKKHLHHNIDLTSFKPKDVMFLELAFDAGARCMYNELIQREQKQIETPKNALLVDVIKPLPKDTGRTQSSQGYRGDSSRHHDSNEI